MAQSMEVDKVSGIKLDAMLKVVSLSLLQPRIPTCQSKVSRYTHPRVRLDQDHQAHLDPDLDQLLSTVLDSQVLLNLPHTETMLTQLPTLSEAKNSPIPTKVSACGGKLSSVVNTKFPWSKSETEEIAAEID